MTGALIFGLYIFVLAVFVGYQVISKVPPSMPKAMSSLATSKAAGF